ncbi:MAG: isoleucine--tRNA ligase [Candidatus Anstonellales archaeon]
MYNHKEIEQHVFSYWEKNKIYEKQKAKAKSQAKANIYFLDGPPYVTGEIHPGTGWNKCIKDAFLRYYRMNGYDISDKPGFDTHGLPIEVKVEQKLGFRSKQDIEKFGVEEFIKECKAFADKYIEIMSNQFKQLAVWMDWENPYVTYKDEYIERCWAMLKKAHEKGLLYKDYYVVPHCFRCQTTLANYELEYWDETDPSIYVLFKLKGKQNTYALVWTTTPWTLVANMAIAIHEELEYAEVEIDGKNVIMLASKVNEILDKSKQSGVVKKVFKGSALVGIEYEHPFQDLIKKKATRKIVPAKDIVSEETGTGIVHIAPGHGPEDFELGKKQNIEAFCPVDEQGKYDEQAGIFANMHVKEANAEIIKVLENRGLLFINERIVHRYAHCWRCKTPLIYIKTEQWFLKITDIKGKMLDEIKNIVWVPQIAQTRFADLIEKAPDWCISRQRYWGIPLPIWECDECKSIQVIGSKKELQKQVKELHRPYIDNITFECECSGVMRRVNDVLDVWFDSGNAVWASLSSDNEQADFIIEGHDQIRGWYYSLLGCGIIYIDKVPYKSVVMHGFFVDEKGEKMSKSLGNFVPLQEILDKYGLDAFRLFSLSNNVWEDVKFNWKELDEAKAFLFVYLNLYNYLNSNIKQMPKKPASLLIHDKWLLSRLNTTIEEYHEAMLEKNIAKALRVVKFFVLEDLSKKYMKVAKDYISQNEHSSIYAFYQAMLKASLLLSPFAPVIVDFVYINYFSKFENKHSIHLHDFPEVDGLYIDKKLEKLADVAFNIISNALELRAKTNIKLRWPLRSLYISSKEADVIEAVKHFSPLMLKLVNVKEIKLDSIPEKDVQVDESGKIAISNKIEQELYEEGIYNDIARRIQMTRKKLGLNEQQVAALYISGEPEFMRIIKENEQKLKSRAKLSMIKIEEQEGQDYEHYLIDGKPIRIKIVL